MDIENIVYDYDPKKRVTHGSPESTTTATVATTDLWDGVEELIRGKILKL